MAGDHGHSMRCVFKKWPDTLHWSVMTTVLARTDRGLWLGTKQGTPIARPTGPPAKASGDSVVLYTPGTPWVARWYACRTAEGRASMFSCYVDITTPPVFKGDSVEVVDLDLDVVRTWEGAVAVLDEDEFGERSSSLGYPERLVAAAMASCEQVQQALSTSLPPFGGEHTEIADDWFSRCMLSTAP